MRNVSHILVKGWFQNKHQKVFN